jgi:hypothetical protein
MGYGKAEAMLFRKHPGKFNTFGTAKWAGRIYGGIRTGLALSRGCIYYGPFGSGLFQRVYHSPNSWLADFPLSLEWNILTVLLLGGGLFSPLLLMAGLLSGLTSLWTVIQQSLATDVPVSQRRWLARLLVGALQYIQPIARGWARVKRLLAEHAQRHRTKDWPMASRKVVRHLWKRHRTRSYWTDNGIEKDALLQPLWQRFRDAGYPTLSDTGWKAWDLAIDEHPWACMPMMVVVENHGGGKRLVRIKIAWNFTPLSKGLLWACAMLLGVGFIETQWWLVGTAGMVLLGGVARVAYRSASLMHQACQLVNEVAAKFALTPLTGRHGQH